MIAAINAKPLGRPIGVHRMLLARVVPAALSAVVFCVTTTVATGAEGQGLAVVDRVRQAAQGQPRG